MKELAEARIAEVIQEMSEKEFRMHFRGLARTEAFSGYVSGDKSPESVEKLKDECRLRGILWKFWADDTVLEQTTKAILARILKNL